ncbi:hypothetical protein ACTOB_006563 [Actinoplanes oblitus]|uniref:Uncharacterized protein n=1 Tax=Actinoplanes oblitus TaxID=3040509 RepID=A0ABY8WC87_9ACTN|nr:hypothetical protein [Actinoplanes oblitus]WIM94535.1 hypothetical protein ACTOB_006563 [Actinoplanes oblitus]
MDPFGLVFDPQSASQVAAALVPYVVAAAKSLGKRLWSQAEDVAAQEAAGWGRRLVERLQGSAQGDAVAGAVEELVADPDDMDTHAALRLRVGKALAGSPELLADVAHLLRQAQQATASGSRSVAGSVSDSIVVTGDRSVGSAGGSVITGDNNTMGHGSLQ